MTVRLYYTDPALREFDAVVTELTRHEGRPAVRLDRTAFYPTSGGQPFDTGRLGSVRVDDVVDLDGDVLHIVDAPLSPGVEVHGKIDWPRRFDHMQQHTGQHVLSAAFDLLFENRTVSFHMGTELSTIDVAREQPLAEVERAVDQANRIVWEDRAVSIRFVSEEEARALPLRKESLRQGELRLIDVDQFDLSACGGTHVARTGSIGTIAALHAERFKGGMRVTFVCGARLVRVLRDQRDVVARSIRALSVLPSELPAAIEKLQADAKTVRKQMGVLQLSLAHSEAERLFAALPNRAAPSGPAGVAGSPIGTSDVRGAGVHVVVEVYADEWDANGLKAVASALAGKGHVAVALISSARPALVVVARSADVGVDASLVVRALTAQFGGRGGGKPELAQAGGLDAPAERIAEAAREALPRP
jgi:alanyl-tRNA synthetase